MIDAIATKLIEQLIEICDQKVNRYKCLTNKYKNCLKKKKIVPTTKRLSLKSKKGHTNERPYPKIFQHVEYIKLKIKFLFQTS